MINKHIPVMLNEVKSFIPNNKKIDVIDATFGAGGYTKSILNEFNVNKLIAIDRDPTTKQFANEVKKEFNNFHFANEKFSKIDDISKSLHLKKKFDVIIFDLGVSSNQIEDSKRGFSFQKDGPLDMNMSSSSKKAYEVINLYDEKKLANIIFEYGEERFSRRIAKNIVNNRNIKSINSTLELAKIVEKCFPINSKKFRKTHPATRTFQALRIYINDEINELKNTLNKTIELLNNDGFLIIVSFQSLEDRIVKEFFNHNSGKKWRSSRHYPELVDLGPITLNIITKKPIRPTDIEISNNPRSRSAKLRVAQKI
tara:strand:+ start:594 stop:1529 length:936 start_codon:yes stop_codon:yes gene_type:complete